MKSSNPVFGRGYAAIKPGTLDRTVDQLEESYAAPAASSLHTGRMTIDDVVIRTSILFVVLVAVGGYAWSQNLGAPALFIGAIGGLVLAMVNSFSKKVRPIAAIGYAAFEGLVLGVLSHMYETQYPGIVSQAVLGTIAAFAGVLIAYTSKKVQVTPKFQRATMGALVGYMILGLISMFAAFAGVGGGYGFYGVSGLGLLLALGGVAFASFFLILDFDMVSQMIKNGAPQEESWRAGFGLMVTVVWLYMEILRLISILRRD